jgi:hypothetical protein
MDTVMEFRELALEFLAVILPRDAVHPGGRLSLQRNVGPSEQCDVDVVQERSELLLLPCLGRLPYALQSG